MWGREVKIKVWTYSEGDEFPIRRSSFSRRHWKAFPIAFVAIILAAAAWSSIAALRGEEETHPRDSDGSRRHSRGATAEWFSIRKGEQDNIQLRVKGLSEILSGRELARILYGFAPAAAISIMARPTTTRMPAR